MASQAEIGLIGLGVMGQNLALNIADHGFAIAVYNRTAARTEAFAASEEARARPIAPCLTLQDLVGALSAPRAIILMVQAGAATDDQIAALAPLLAPEPKDRIRLEGHTDSIGGRDYNLKLSEARARSVRDWLARNGHVPASAPVRGFGFDRPVAPNRTADGKDDPAGRQKNRRVEVVVDACR